MKVNVQIKVDITASELIERGLWLRACELFGINEWAVNEGLMSSDKVFTIDEDVAVKWGLLTER